VTLRDPRTSVNYKRMNAVIALIQKRGPQTLPQICSRLKINETAFTVARGSHPGQLAMEDMGVVIPRPVASENYTYKLASTFRSGNIDTDGEPNIQQSTGDLLTRVATIYTDVDALVSQVPGRTRIRKLLQRMGKALELVIVSANDAAEEVDAPVSARASYVLDAIFPPGVAAAAPAPVLTSVPTGTVTP
jgi:hypothetical protein